MMPPLKNIPDSKVHGANMGPTWVLSAPDGPHVGPMNLAIRDPIIHMSHSLYALAMFSGSIFINLNQLDPWIYQIYSVYDFASRVMKFCDIGEGLAQPFPMSQNFVIIEVKLSAADHTLVDIWTMDQDDPLWIKMRPGEGNCGVGAWISNISYCFLMFYWTVQYQTECSMMKLTA